MSATICPFDDTALLAPDENGDKLCTTCKRLWFDVVIDGEETIQSRPRKVRMIKFPEDGDKIDDCIKPI